MQTTDVKVGFSSKLLLPSSNKPVIGTSPDGILGNQTVHYLQLEQKTQKHIYKTWKKKK